ncbi:uncharacterized protein A4U43_C01F34900 [Asparagus officinalis]|uniref:Uncharacterized protein n=1 Tax=Asparagus officinalis TaxID=4686 RepID=A0A5P1FV33_ASPOF|nr:uncharacterized protein A4U43_C01F34900 [Asparagus officinalis]
MAMAEPADFVHVFDVNSGYQQEQELDFFGEISGMSFSPDTEALFVGVDTGQAQVAENPGDFKDFLLESGMGFVELKLYYVKGELTDF